MKDKTSLVAVAMAAPAAIATWSGWVELGTFCGFGDVQPLPGIWGGHINTVLTLPVSVEAYGAFALQTWTQPGLSKQARRFAVVSSVVALCLGLIAQGVSHVMSANHDRTAPGLVVVFVSAMPVITLGLFTYLVHLIRAGHGPDTAEDIGPDIAQGDGNAAQDIPEDSEPDTAEDKPPDELRPRRRRRDRTRGKTYGPAIIRLYEADTTRTQQDIAARAGCSVKTVSRTLSDYRKRQSQEVA